MSKTRQEEMKELIQILYQLNWLKKNPNDPLFKEDTINCLLAKQNELKYKIQNRKHTILEKQFNYLLNGSFIILHKDDNIYMLEIEQDYEYPIDLSKTIFNTVPNNISGTLKLWNMRMSVQMYTDISNQSDTESDEEFLNDDRLLIAEESEQLFNNKKLINTHSYLTKDQIISILKKYSEEKHFNFYNNN